MNRPRDAAAVLVFPPAVPAFTILLGIGLSRLWPIDLGFEPATPGRYWIGALIITSAGCGLGFWSVLLLRRRGQSANPWTPTLHVEDGGPFRITRNPMYLQMVVGCIGCAVIFWDAWVLVLTPLGAWVLYRLAIVPEEAYLERKFGDTYLDYKRRVRRWL